MLYLKEYILKKTEKETFSLKNFLRISGIESFEIPLGHLSSRNSRI